MFDMKLSDRTYILILLLLILGLSYTSYWQLKRFGQSLSEISFPKIEMPETKLELEGFSSSGKENKQEWLSPDGKLELVYSANWLAMNETFSEYFGQTQTALAETEILFFAYQFKTEEQALAFLIVGKTSPEKSSEEIIKGIEQNTQEQGGEIEVAILETEDDVAWVEMTSKYPNQSIFYSKGKIIFSDEGTYLIISSASQTDWPKFEQEAQEILDSAQLVLTPE